MHGSSFLNYLRTGNFEISRAVFFNFAGLLGFGHDRRAAVLCVVLDRLTVGRPSTGTSIGDVTLPLVSGEILSFAHSSPDVSGSLPCSKVSGELDENLWDNRALKRAAHNHIKR